MEAGHEASEGPKLLESTEAAATTSEKRLLELELAGRRPSLREVDRRRLAGMIDLEYGRARASRKHL